MKRLVVVAVLGLLPLTAQSLPKIPEVDQWLDRMAGTLIKSEGAVYFAKTLISTTMDGFPILEIIR